MTKTPHFDLHEIARAAMLARGFQIEFPVEVISEVNAAKDPSVQSSKVKDLTRSLWSSIDNDDSKDLDQIEYSEIIPGGVRVYVAIADVSSFVKKGSATDRYARRNTTSVYTGVEVFPMLPHHLSTDLTSLNEGKRRLAIVIEMDVLEDGTLSNYTAYHALVLNKARLTYTGVSAWLENSDAPFSPITTEVLQKLNSNTLLQEQILMQEKITTALQNKRRQAGALDFKSSELSTEIKADGKIELTARESDRASHIIEELMIAANQSVDAFLESRKFPCMQRVVTSPKNWPRMVELAQQHGGSLPSEPNGLALQEFLNEQELSDPKHFPDLSLAMIKLIGRGEYAVKIPGASGLGHFGLAASNYSHTTAPNRRYPDLVTQRLLVAAFSEQDVPYANAELKDLARYCTEKEDDANRVERQVKKSISALALTDKIGEVFDGIITGASEKGVFVRITHPPVEGKIEGDTDGLDVGESVKVQLTGTNPERGYIDFEVFRARR